MVMSRGGLVRWGSRTLWGLLDERRWVGTAGLGDLNKCASECRGGKRTSQPHMRGGGHVGDVGCGDPPRSIRPLSRHLELGLAAPHEQVSHAVADQPAGPYTKVGAAVQQPFHHNPTVAYDNSTGTFLLYSIGNGSGTKSFFPQLQRRRSEPRALAAWRSCSGGDHHAVLGIVCLAYITHTLAATS